MTALVGSQLKTFLGIIETFGGAVREFLMFLGNFANFALSVTWRTITPPWRYRMIIDECVGIGLKSLPIVALTSLFVGMVMVLQTGVQLSKFGAKNYVPGISFIANAREFVPAFCAIVVGARVAASITAELGTMRVTEQIDALDILNVDPIRYLSAPRVIAMTLMLPMISTLSLLSGFFGGMLVAQAGLGIDPLQYYMTTLKFANLADVYGGITKTFFFGFIIAVTGCYYGFNTSGGAAGVGRATTNSVVATLVQILICDYILTTVILAMTGIEN